MVSSPASLLPLSLEIEQSSVSIVFFFSGLKSLLFLVYLQPISVQKYRFSLSIVQSKFGCARIRYGYLGERTNGDCPPADVWMELSKFRNILNLVSDVPNTPLYHLHQIGCFSRNFRLSSDYFSLRN